MVYHAIAENESKNTSVHHTNTRVIHGNQGVSICDACCKGNKCNSADCSILKRKAIMKTEVAFLISISLFNFIKAGPVCMQCTDAADISDCIGTSTQCGDNEQCYLEKSTSGKLTISYNAGCRSKTVCDIMAALSAGTKRMISCNACCGDAPDQYGPCNAKLCGLQDPLALQDTCLVCSGIHSDVSSCTTAATCPPNEACFTGIRVVGTLIRYVFGCYDERVCRAMIENDRTPSVISHHTRVIHGDYGTRICDACCKGNKCNSADCFDLKKNMTLDQYISRSSS